MKMDTAVQNCEFGNVGRRWYFNAPGYSYSTTNLIGGKTVARKIANVIGGAIKRTGHMDNLARANMEQIMFKAAQQVKAGTFVKH